MVLRFDGWFWVTCVVVGVVLGLFGVRYNRWVAGLESEGHDRGFMGFIVALGCLGKDTLAPGGGQGAAGECGDSTGD